MMKDSGLRLRVERELREKFVETCRRNDITAAQVLRKFMREYVAEHDADPEVATGGRPSNDRIQTEKKRKQD